MNKPNDLLSSGEPSGADLAVELVDGAANGVLGVGDFALANTEERGDIAASAAGNGGVGHSGFADGLDLGLVGVGSHGSSPSEVHTQYMQTSIDCNADQHLRYARRHSDNRAMHKRTIKENLTTLMQRSGHTSASLGRETGVDQSIIHRIATGKTKRPQDETVVPLATYFQITPDQLRGHAALDFDTLPLRRDDLMRRSVPAADEGADAYVELPFMRRIGISSDLRRESVELTGETRKIPRSDMARCSVDEAHAAFVRTQGDTMAPVFIDGSIAGVNMAATEVVDGKIYAVQISDEIWIKRAYRIPGGGLRLSSYDQDVEDMRFTPDMLRTQQVAIVGRVFYNATCYL